jgi:hypothetical protein
MFTAILFERSALFNPASYNIPFFRRHIGFIILGHCFGNDDPLHDQFLFGNDLLRGIIFNAIGRSGINIVGRFGRMTLDTSLLDDTVHFRETGLVAFAC